MLIEFGLVSFIGLCLTLIMAIWNGVEVDISLVLAPFTIKKG